MFGITSGASTNISLTAKLSDASFKNALTADSDGKYTLTVNGTPLSFTADQTVSDVMKAVNSADLGVTMTYNSYSDAFSLTAASTGKGYEVSTGGSLGTALFGTNSTTVAGRNAVVNINGTTIERTANTFSYDGMSLTVSGTTGSYQKNADGSFALNTDGTLVASSGTTENAATVSSKRDTSALKTMLTGFVNDYNTLISKLNGYTHAKATYKDYPPLTDAQRDEMSDDQVEKWEEKAQEGLLSGDDDITSFLQDMRAVLYTKNSSGLSLSQFGIDTSDDWTDYGKLVIDDDDLDEALATNPDKLTALFTGTNGLASKLNDACRKAVNSSSASPGTLVALAGQEGKATEGNNTISDKLDDIAEKLEQLQDLYDLRRERYWSQFTTMETTLSNLSSTSSWLTNMLG
ncbi:MAG: flagellar filament capping protein FliD [Oscillospiraceae bacterium]